MTTHSKQTLVGMAAALLVIASVPATLHARDRAAAKQARPAAAGSYTRHTERHRTDNGYTRRDTVTTADGRSATRDVVVVNDRATGIRIREGVVTGPGGRTATNSTVTQRTENGYTRGSTKTGPEGKSVTRDVQASCDGAGNCSKTVQRTGAEDQAE